MKKRIIQCLICFIGFCTVFLVGLEGQFYSEASVISSALLQPNVEQAFQNVLCTCVRVQGDGHYGSGSVYRIEENSIVIVTNKHVIQYFGENSYVTFFDGRKAEAEVLGNSENYDVGFLEVAFEQLQEEEIFCYRAICADVGRYNDLMKNDCFFMIDMASEVNSPKKYLGNVVESRKYLADYDVEMFYGDAYTKPGMSGCGLFDAYGNYIAMLSGGTEYLEVAAVPVDVIADEYEKIKK